MLVRAVEPIEGIEIIKKNRIIKSKKLKELTGGPAKFTKAMNIDLSANSTDLTTKTNKLYIIKGDYDNFEIEESKRIDIDSLALNKRRFQK